MNTTEAANNFKTPRTVNLSQLMPTSERDRFERTCETLQAFSELSAVWDGMKALYGEMSVGCKVVGIDDCLHALDAQFAQAFMKAYPTTEYLQDALLQGGLDAIHEARKVQPPTPQATAEPHMPHQPPTNWRETPDMLTWKDIKAMEFEDREAALVAVGFDDAGHETDEALVESINQRLSYLLSSDRQSAIQLLLLARLCFVQAKAKEEAAAAT